MKHSREDLALANAVSAVEALAKWLTTDSPNRWWHQFVAMAHAADALELCLKIRKRVSEKDRVSFIEAAEKAGLAYRPNWWSTRREFIHAHLETTRNVRNSRHTSFDDGAVPPEHMMLTLGSLFLEIELATAERLERCVPRDVWFTIRHTTAAARALEDSVRAAHGYLQCHACSYRLFDPTQDACRLCFHAEPTFICPIDGKMTYVSERRTWLSEPFGTEVLHVCSGCFERLGKERVAYVLSDRSKLGLAESFLLGPKRLIVACPNCGLRCLQLKSTRCLACGMTNEDWCLTDLRLRGLARCEDCKTICSRDIRTTETGERLGLCRDCEAARFELSLGFDDEEFSDDDFGWEHVTDDEDEENDESGYGEADREKTARLIEEIFGKAF